MSEANEEGDIRYDDYDFDELERLMADDPGAAEFPALAEAHRRAGRPDRAREISEAGLEHAPTRMAGHVSLGLALLDLNETEPARREFATILDTLLEPHRLAPLLEQVEEGESEFDRAVDDVEIDRAFVSAASQPDEMHSANKVAEQALFDHVPGDESEIQAPPPDAAHETEELRFDPASTSTFHTQTMASLLEQQGHHEGAEEIRQALTETGTGEVEIEAPSGHDESAAKMNAAARPHEDRPDTTGEEAVRSAAKNGRILTTLQGWLQNLQGDSA